MKIKLMSIGGRKATKENSRAWEKTVDYYAPDMYELIYCNGENDAINKVSQFRPEIVLLLPSALGKDLQKGLHIIERIRSIDAKIAMFVCLGMVDDELEVIDKYTQCGAYKCYTMPVSMDSLFHDMYVALNLE